MTANDPFDSATRELFTDLQRTLERLQPALNSARWARSFLAMQPTALASVKAVAVRRPPGFDNAKLGKVIAGSHPVAIDTAKLGKIIAGSHPVAIDTAKLGKIIAGSHPVAIDTAKWVKGVAAMQPALGRVLAVSQVIAMQRAQLGDLSTLASAMLIAKPSLGESARSVLESTRPALSELLCVNELELEPNQVLHSDSVPVGLIANVVFVLVVLSVVSLWLREENRIAGPPEDTNMVDLTFTVISTLALAGWARGQVLRISARSESSRDERD